jgi:methyl-accepting chemotaxis protein
MDEVVASVKRVTGIIAEIAEASEEQRNGIEQVNQAITQMDDVTQQNAALVEEAAAAANAMQDQASNLSQMVSVFQIDAGMQVQRSTAPAPKADVTPIKSARQLSKRPALRTPQESTRSRALAASGDDWEQF